MKPFSPKKNPQQERARATVDAILQSVALLVDQGDPQGLTTTKIAEKAGVSIGSLYQYFPSKEAVFSSLIEFYFRKELALMKEALEAQREKSLEEGVDAMVACIFEIRVKNLRLERALMQFFSRSGDLEFLRGLDERLLAHIDALLLAGAARGVVARTETSAFVLLHAVRSIFFATTLERPALYARSGELREHLKKIMLAVLKPI